MESIAVLRYIRISPQKVRKLIQVIKGKSVENGLNIIKFMPQRSAGIVEKVIRSAVANATQKDPKVDVDGLKIKNIIIDGGPVLKRFRARARGRGARILKRTSHIRVILDNA
jgi:large subunit ribosomal protein L22